MQLHALWQQCRVAKEAMLQPEWKKAEHPVTILGRGTGLVGGTIKSSLTRDDLHRVLLDGFFPAVSSQDKPQARRRVGLQEIGLPYAADAAITRHLANFLRNKAQGLPLRRTSCSTAASCAQESYAIAFSKH